AEVEFFLRLHGLWEGVVALPPPPEPPFDIETMEPKIAEVAKMIEWSARTTAADVVAAGDACTALNHQLLAAFEHCDLLLTPTLAFDPEPIGQPDRRWIKATYPFNLTRSPAGTVPIGTSPVGLPIGLQIVGPQHADTPVLALMHHLTGA
ncbi:MAG TPA: amidase family protein, partial [Ilumatobacteraceae bacterium]|nr:amidase family protein [Ilumatobacteraceae bacterium]